MYIHVYYQRAQYIYIQVYILPGAYEWQNRKRLFNSHFLKHSNIVRSLSAL